MDDLYLINVAKTEFRECFNLSDPSRLLAIADPGLISFPDGHPSEFEMTGLATLKFRLEELFQRFKAEMAVIVIEIRIQGDVAYDYGWHVLTLVPKEGGKAIRCKNRYVDIWRRDRKGKWKLWMFIDNLDVPEPFLPEQSPSKKI